MNEAYLKKHTQYLNTIHRIGTVLKIQEALSPPIVLGLRGLSTLERFRAATLGFHITGISINRTSVQLTLYQGLIDPIGYICQPKKVSIATSEDNVP